MAEQLLFVTTLIVGAAAGLILAAVVARRRSFVGAHALIVLALAASIWSFGYALEVLDPRDSATHFWAKTQYFGITAIPVAWFIFADLYGGASLRVAWFPRYRILLAVLPLLTLILVWTNDFHGLVWSHWQVRDLGLLRVLEVQHGPWFWVFLSYGYVLMLTGSILLVHKLFGSVRVHRRQIGLVLLAVAIPLLGNLIYISPVNPFPFLDWTPPSFVIASFLFALSLYRYQLGRILPVARQTVFAGLADSILVLDEEDRIVDVNRAAERLFGVSIRTALGKEVGQILSDAAQTHAGNKFLDYQGEIALEDVTGARTYEVRITPLWGPHSAPIGRLVVLHDITQHRRDQATLEEARTQLEQTVVERTEALRQTVAELERELSQRILAEQNLQASLQTNQVIFESAGDAIILFSPSGEIRRTNRKAGELLGYTQEQFLELSMRDICAPAEIQELNEVTSAILGNADIPPYLRHYYTRDGAMVPVEVKMVLIRDLDGEPRYLHASARDVSERVKAEQAQSRLMGELTQTTEDLRSLTFRLQEVQEFERRQLAAELHDTVGQNLTGLNLNLKVIQNQVGPEAAAELHKRLADSLALVEQTTRQVRNALADLRPPLLEEFGLVPALTWYAQQFAERTGIRTTVEGEEFAPRLSSTTDTVLFRLVQEALNNVLKHARATQARVLVEPSETGGCITVEDDGQGLDMTAAVRPIEPPRWGHLIMQQRAISLGGEMRIDSTPGGGARVSVRFRR